jgi:predicted RNA-binding Zn-ribbon protein involved in translation (DUF1610 family)
MKLKLLMLLSCISCYVIAGNDKELAAYCPTVGQVIIRVIKDRFASRSPLQERVKKQKAKSSGLNNESLGDAQQLLRPHKYNLSHDVI